MPKSKIKDIYEGQNISAWEDEGWVYLSFPFCVINIPKENWKEVREELKSL